MCWKDDLEIGKEYNDGKNIWLKVSEDVFVENTPVDINELLKDPENIKPLYKLVQLMSKIENN